MSKSTRTIGKRWQKTWEWLHPEISGPVITPPGPRSWPYPAVARLLPDTASYAAGEPIVIAFESMSGNRTDWITIVRADAAADTYEEWRYTGGGMRGSLTFGGLQPGRYEARAHFDWPRGGYEVRGRVAVVVGR